MEFLGDIFLLYWKEVIVAVMLTATLPFIRKYVRRRRAMVINFFKERERLKAALSEAEGRAESERKAREELERKLEAETVSRQKAHDEAEGLRAELGRERTEREEAESRYQLEADERQKAQSEAKTLLASLGREQKAREEAESNLQSEVERLQGELEQERKTHEASERKYQAEAGKAQQEADNLRAELQQERTAREQAEHKFQHEAGETYKTSQVDWNDILSELGKIIPPAEGLLTRPFILSLGKSTPGITKLELRLMYMFDKYLSSLLYAHESRLKVSNAERMIVLTCLAVYIAKSKDEGNGRLDINDAKVKALLDSVCATKKDLEAFLTDKAAIDNMMQFIREVIDIVVKAYNL